MDARFNQRYLTRHEISSNNQFRIMLPPQLPRIARDSRREFFSNGYYNIFAFIFFFFKKNNSINLIKETNPVYFCSLYRLGTEISWSFSRFSSLE